MGCCRKKGEKVIENATRVAATQLIAALWSIGKVLKKEME
ncbi:hypothetical protein Tmath_0829 [Thermoanaerobacter mathranii subsp. mathranii str. A3]|uniref:Uncharacterized protein n=1 Tax=Thermoanaerobacter mathranii subsp. mathranii (strain DSM 11426 / CCUG 53645 / CIP 108742 / A3) TaxID=583358 RepID=A0ABN3Z1D0_THEM3|nr:hypothetical protein Tmath_0829 [Thermoanaerobacter mathranii subsp. mathranii str. A3]